MRMENFVKIVVDESMSGILSKIIDREVLFFVNVVG